MLDSFLTVNPDSLHLLDDDCVESELFAEDTYRHAPFPLPFPVIKVGHINATLLKSNSPNMIAY